MLVYADQKMKVNPASFFAHLLKVLSSTDPSSLESNRNLLIEAGMLESGLCDELFPAEDSITPMTSQLRRLLISLARMYCRSLKGVYLKPLEAFQTLGSLMRDQIPEQITIKIPEGFAYYGLYPETYIKAAEKFCSDFPKDSAVCIGIRSIGTSLSALIAATLQEFGWQVESFTMRPQGHPYVRRAKFSPKLKNKIWRWRRSKFLIVDEGPGLSGSSMTCVAKELTELGINKEDILFFPSSDQSPDILLNQDAKTIWKEHRKYVCSFESLFEREQELSIFPNMISVDISAGKWRNLFYDTKRDFPATNPYHERRKYLLRKENQVLLAKFAGFKVFSNHRLEIAKKLGELGFSPQVVNSEGGFFVYQFVPGTPLRFNEKTFGLIDQMARYVAARREIGFIKNHNNLDLMMNMIDVNVEEGLGHEWREKLQQCEWSMDELSRAGSSAVDGKMLPHKWIRTEKGYMKTDSVDHHCDQFLPQSQDIAWDVAGVLTEFNLTPELQSHFISAYKGYSHDLTIEKRLPFYLIAYLSFRLGYVSLSAESLKHLPEGKRFTALQIRYSSALQARIREALNTVPQKMLSTYD
jgi:hypothetical protein